MIETIYIERGIIEHTRTQEVCARFPRAQRIVCDRYGEIFNLRRQNFRLQKSNPALIIATKHAGHVLKVPQGYGVGGEHNYYFSHMLNCLYDCRYCFLQGMFRSAHYVLFVNYEDFEQAMDNTLTRHDDHVCWFFSGYDCDSLVLEPVTGFVQHILTFFAARPQAWLELRTKSTQIRSLLNNAPLNNVVIAFSFTPQAISASLEHKTPSVSKRIDAMCRLQAAGWKVGLRFDPLIYADEYKTQYQELFVNIFSRLQASNLHSVSLGAFRLPPDYHRNIVKLYPDEPLFAGPLLEHSGMVSYSTELEHAMLEFCTAELMKYIDPDIFYPCTQAA